MSWNERKDKYQVRYELTDNPQKLNENVTLYSVMTTKASTYEAANNLISVQGLHFVVQLTEIPNQWAHTSWKSMHAIH